jgi:hypothetical protein
MHICHAAMQTYLADLEVRHGITIRYQRWSSRYQDRAAFRHEVEILGPFSGLPAPFDIPYKEEIRKVEVAHCLPQTGERFELVHNDNKHVVAAVEGRRITLAFDLERLFEAPQGDMQPGLVLEAVALHAHRHRQLHAGRQDSVPFRPRPRRSAERNAAAAHSTAYAASASVLALDLAGDHLLRTGSCGARRWRQRHGTAGPSRSVPGAAQGRGGTELCGGSGRIEGKRLLDARSCDRRHVAPALA